MAGRIITLGKTLGLYRASTAGQVFTVVALDHQDTLRQALNPADPLQVTDQDLTDFKLDAIEILGPEVSGILLDPVWGTPQAIERGLFRRTGLLIELERADYNMEPLPLDTELRAGWSVAKTKQIGADGVKLFFYYHPDNPQHAPRQENLIRQLVEECSHYDIPFFAEPIAYANPAGPPAGTPAYADDLPRVVVESARRTAGLGVDVLKLEFPLDVRHQPNEARWREACERLSAVVEVPWVLLSGGVDFETFCRQVAVACKAGASGFIAGRSTWATACEHLDRQERRRWLAEEGRSRMQRLADIAGTYAVPWTRRLQPEPVSTTWFASYAI